MSRSTAAGQERPVMPDDHSSSDVQRPFIHPPFAAVRRIATEYGTPTFIFDRKRFEHSAQDFMKVWQEFFPNGNVYYSYKTNFLPEVCVAAHTAGMGADTVSHYELEHARRLCPDGPVVLNGPMKTRDELAQAVEMGALINIDCLEELDTL